MGISIQQYCLRWNNHRSNLLLVFEHLFQTEAFTDVTLACEGSSIKAHKMVLAACSSYFQDLFMQNDCRHPIVILKDIKFSEIKAILEYMYKGEVNVAQDQLAGLLKAAETLKVKGLVEDHQNNSETTSPPHQSSYPPPPPPHIGSDYNMHSSPPSFPKATTNSNSNSNSIPSKFMNNDTVYDSPYNASVLPERSNSMSGFPIWSSSNHPLSPLPKKKKFMSSTSSNKDTPILRTVLGHTSLQPNSIGEREPPQQKSINYSMSNASCNSNEPTELNSEVLGDSPDHFNMDDSGRSVESDKVPEDNHSFNLDGDDKLGIAAYVPTQKPEWKRYKQYTRNDIMAAIDAVRAGMSALQAARKYGVPSRTLYDKVKKLGITTSRPFRKGGFLVTSDQGMSLKDEMMMDDGSGYSPEEHPLELSSNMGENGSLNLNGNENLRELSNLGPHGNGNLRELPDIGQHGNGNLSGNENENLNVNGGGEGADSSDNTGL